MAKKKKTQLIYLTQNGLDNVKILMGLQLANSQRPSISQAVEDALAFMVQEKFKAKPRKTPPPFKYV